jgi:nitroimidazol reductase NimA-like FMN-containing flavoprotein (pyridoxamine 5'-phosphate oxidase superfamily)
MAETTAIHTLEPLDEAACWELLAARVVGRLVVAVGSQPDIFPVNYVIDDGAIVIRTAEGTKLAAALMGQLVAFEIDHIDEQHRLGWSVVVHGEARESRTLPDSMRDQELPVEPWADGEKLRYIRITPRRISGRHLVSVNRKEPTP